MFNSISHSGIFVLDQDEAVDFYVGKLGLEVGADVDLGFMRWLTVHVPGNPDHQILLEKPGPPTATDDVTAQVRDLVTKGALGLSLILTTDDCRKTYEELVAKGVTFIQEPADRPYGVEAVLRDNTGNWLVLVEPKPYAAEDLDSQPSSP
jgi:catechol 2,3-dioxygenase-like lactoylglutathione lyase family enzyme